MCFQVISRINTILAKVIMRIASSLFRTSTRPVFHHGYHTILAPTIGNLSFPFGSLEAIDVSPSQIGCQLRIAAKGPREAHPAWLGSQIDLWRKRRGNTQRTIFLRRYFTKVLYQFRTKGSRQSQ